MTVDFNDYFWGEKNSGFDVLYHNMKYGLVASKELLDFFREKSCIEEQNSKLMSKLAHKAGTGTLNSTFAPIWTILKSSAERLSTLHMQMVQKLSELVRDVAKYADELHKKHKSVKDEESQTLECVKAIQTSTAEVQKARDLYCSKVQELEKMRKDHASQKDIEKLETKLRKLQEDYKVLLDKHCPIKSEFECRMTQTCRHFQDIEEVHLRQMKEFLSTYLELLQNNHDMVGQVHSDFKRQFLDMTVDKLLEQFVLNKYTGLEKPELLELEIIPFSTNVQLSSASETKLNYVTCSSVSSPNNSAMSINRASAITIDQKCSEGLSLHSSTGSAMHADIVSSKSDPITSPTPCELMNTQTIAMSMNNSNTNTLTTATATTVKSNFLNWFSSNIPNRMQQQSQQQQQLRNATMSTSMISGSDSFGMETSSPIAISSSILTTTTATFATTTTASSTITKSFITSTFKTKNMKTFVPTSNTTTITTINTTIKTPFNIEIQSPQDNTIQGIPASQSVITNTASTQRRTTSLLNIFSSNSQVTGILRSRRDKTKTKKSKKKKDAEFSDNKIEDENNFRDGPIKNSSMEYDVGVVKIQNPTASNLSGLPSSSLPTVNNTETSCNVVINSNTIDDQAIITNTGITTLLSDGTLGLSSGPTSTVLEIGKSVCFSHIDSHVDEDGYSVQPPKDTTWEKNHNNNCNFYSDSDSDSDNDKPERRIHVKIKPLNNGQAPMSASVDELRATVDNISLSPTGIYSHHSQQLQQQSRLASRQQSPEISNASTPTATVHPYAPLQSPTLSSSHNSKYTDLGDIFSELGDVNFSTLNSNTFSKTHYTRQIPTPTSVSGNSIAIPRPPSRRAELVAATRGGISPAPLNNINRADSIGSLDFRTAIGGLGSSRGPSPLTIGISDTIPIAVAFHEIIHAYFRGSDENRCQVKISGDMMLSFPAGIVGILANNPNPAKLAFRIKNIHNLENFIPNSKLVQIDKNLSSSLSTMLEFNMSALTALLRRQSEHNPTALYFNVDILKYQVRVKPGANSCPFQLVSYWKCEPTFTALKIDYKYNNHAMASSYPLLNVSIFVPVNGSVRNVQSKPHSAWLGDSNRLVWNFTDISHNSLNAGIGTLRARLELKDGPSTPALLSIHFNCEGTTLSGIEFELLGSGYRLSLVKRRFVSGKYICEGDGIGLVASPIPPTFGSTSPFSAKSN